MTSLLTENTTQVEQHAKQFTLQDSTGSTRLVFYPRAPLPGPGVPAGGAQVEYHGPEGDFTFRGEAVNQQSSPLGQLITVTLMPDADAGQLDFTLVLPLVYMGGKKAQELTTVAIKTKGIGHVVEPAGADRVYRVLQLQGVAAAVIASI
jgi:hypothetical protein